MARLVLIDGNALIHRAYHAYPPLTTSEGELVGAVYGFTSILLTVLGNLSPQYVVVCFDRKEPTFRHKKFKEYKIHRKPMDEELVRQIPKVHEIVETLNIPIFEKEGYEADDIIGTITDSILNNRKEKELDVMIASGDMDTLQLVVDDKVRVYTLKKGIKDIII